MKLRHLFENSRSYGQPYTEEEKQKLRPPSISNIDKAFIIGKTIFDNEYGKGQTPNNQEVLYHGFVIEMKPSDFLKIVSKEDREKDATEIAQKMLDNIPFGSPTLYITANMDEWKKGSALQVKIVGHEGRARSMASEKINGDIMIPIHVIPRGMFKKDMTEDFFKHFSKSGFIHQDSALGSKPIMVETGRIWKNK